MSDDLFRRESDEQSEPLDAETAIEPDAGDEPAAEEAPAPQPEALTEPEAAPEPEALPLDLETPEPLLPIEPDEAPSFLDAPAEDAAADDLAMIEQDLADEGDAETSAEEESLWTTPEEDASAAEADLALKDAPGDTPDAADTAVWPPQLSDGPAETTAVIATPAETASGDAAVPADGTAASEASPLLAEGEPRGMDLGPEKRLSPWLWIALAAFVVVGLVVAGFLYWRSATAPVPVPGVTGKNAAQATQALNDAGLRVGEVSMEPTSTAPEGTVVGQEPEAGKEADRNSAVKLIVATSPEVAQVPDILGRTLDDAETTLAAEQLRPFRVESFSTTVAAGTIIAQLPEATTELPPGSAVAIVVSTGVQPTSVGVPNLSGLTEGDALRVLEALDLTGVVYRSATASVSAGDIAQQQPKAGTRVAPGSTVQFLVSQGKGTVSITVPDVTGKKQAAAETQLKKLKLQVATRSVTSKLPIGEVVSQVPTANSRTAKGATIGLLISKGSATTAAVPDLTAKPSLEASGALGAAGFKAVFLGVPSEERPDSIFAQFPAPGTQWPLRYPVVAIFATADR